ncbi:hypothetical protein Enr17x_37450 [Gimesia fumaroli]|uniref:Uncharacterized protein n=1 Tax=Gimesia fumaroli TaxID=2527976 RepID=A0A518IF34_9PLAN|nr:hypothetical protein Enr17x_37450 [Gimesia fumaroli]
MHIRVGGITALQSDSPESNFSLLPNCVRSVPYRRIFLILLRKV